MTLIDRGLDFKVSFASTTPSVSISFDATVKQLTGYTAGAEIDTDTDDVLLVTKQRTQGKPKLQSVQVTTQSDPATMVSLLSVASSATNSGTLTIASQVSGAEGQTVLAVKVASCEMDTVENEAFPTMTITFMPTGGIVENNPDVVIPA